jgi:hypothetical protein
MRTRAARKSSIERRLYTVAPAPVPRGAAVVVVGTGGSDAAAVVAAGRDDAACGDETEPEAATAAATAAMAALPCAVLPASPDTDVGDVTAGAATAPPPPLEGVAAPAAPPAAPPADAATGFAPPALTLSAHATGFAPVATWAGVRGFALACFASTSFAVDAAPLAAGGTYRPGADTRRRVHTHADGYTHVHTHVHVHVHVRTHTAPTHAAHTQFRTQEDCLENSVTSRSGRCKSPQCTCGVRKVQSREEE